MKKSTSQMMVWAGLGVALWYFWNHRQMTAQENPLPEYYDYY